MDEDRELAKRRLGSLVGGKWTLERVLGAGGVGAVYEARSAAGEMVAIKVLHTELAHKTDVKERFLREGVLANRVGHDGALKILDSGTTDDGAGYLIMELLEGETLTELMRKDGPIGVKELFGYLDQVLDVLVAAHDADVIHRDLKPDNLFLTVTGQLKVLDFGLARRLSDIKGSFKTKTGLALGTLPYMAPEQALGRRSQVDGRVDLFALGAMAFRVLARRKIHEADSEAELLMKMASTPAALLGEAAPHLPVAVQQVVDLALAFSKEARYPDARTMQQDVRDVLLGHPPRYASRQNRQRSNETRVEPWLANEPASRRLARTEPLEARVNTEPLPASTQLDAPLIPPPPPAAAGPAAPILVPYAAQSGAGSAQPALAPGIRSPPVVMAPTPIGKSNTAFVAWLVGGGAVLALLAAGVVAVWRRQPSSDQQTVPLPVAAPRPKLPAATLATEPERKSPARPAEYGNDRAAPSASYSTATGPPIREAEGSVSDASRHSNTPPAQVDGALNTPDTLERHTDAARPKATSGDDKSTKPAARPSPQRLERPRD